MIKRISMWKLKNSSEAKKMKTALMSMETAVSSLHKIEVGINESQHPSAFDIVFIGTFVNKQALNAFEADTYHKQIGAVVDELKEKRVVVDYEY